MPKANSQSIAAISSKIFALLEPLESSDRHRVFQGTMVLLGESASLAAAQPAKRDGPGGREATATEKQFFDEKVPNSKVEELAVAARFLELHRGAEAHTKEQLASIIKAARRNFDAKNFTRDIDTARTQGYINKGGSAAAGYTLSYYGQNYVDSLPDRKAAKELKRPKRSGKLKKNSQVGSKVKK